MSIFTISIAFFILTFCIVCGRKKSIKMPSTIKLSLVIILTFTEFKLFILLAKLIISSGILYLSTGKYF